LPLPLTQNLAPTESRQDITRLARLTRKPGYDASVPLDAAARLRHHQWMEKLCAQCGAAMTCQQEAGCWCAELPHVPMPAGDEGCLCRNCLLAKIAEHQQAGKIKQA
jgi:hypothetical protein